METAITKKAGLTGFQLKVLALALMVLDHIHYFFEFTGYIPTVFSMLGRLSAPIFLFIVVEGYSHTRNKKKYFLRVWAISAVMGAINYAIAVFGFARPDGFVPQNNIFATFTVLIVLWQGIGWLAQRKWLLGALALAGPFLLWFGFAKLPLNIMPWAYLVETTVFPLPMMTEGGVPILISGILMYALRKHRIAQVTAFVVSTLGWNVFALLTMLNGQWALLFTDFYEWMGVFAAVFMLLYNGERGRGLKTFFYTFYPAHVYLFFGLSMLLYPLIAP